MLQLPANNRPDPNSPLGRLAGDSAPLADTPAVADLVVDTVTTHAPNFRDSMSGRHGATHLRP